MFALARPTSLKPKNSCSYATKAPQAQSQTSASSASPPDISGLLSLKLKYGSKLPPQKEHVNELKKYFNSIGLKNYVKRVQEEKAKDPYRLELERYRKTNPSECNSPEKLQKLFPLIAQKNPWPTKEEAKAKAAPIFGLKGNETEADLPVFNAWEHWQKDKMALYDIIQDALDATDDASNESDTPFFTEYPADTPLLKEDLALLTPELRHFAATKRIEDIVTQQKVDADERVARDLIGEAVSRDIEIVAGELNFRGSDIKINPFQEKK